jgi:hypothetical protein
MGNTTIDYNDMLEGDALACRPKLLAPGLEILCEYYMPMLGCFSITFGLSFFSLFVQLRRFRNSVARHLGETRAVLFAPRPGGRQRGGEMATILSHSEKMILTLGAVSVTYGLHFVVNGWGTMYPTQHIRGQICDFIGKYVARFGSLLQHILMVL